MKPEPKPLIIAIPKGRIYDELAPIFARISLKPEKAFFEEESRQLQFATNQKHVSLIRVRSFDVATFVAFGGAHIGVAGSDVLEEFHYPDLYVPLDLGIGKCRMSVAAPVEFAEDKSFWRKSHVRVATKYPHLTERYFAERGVQAECIKLNGAIELAPKLGLCHRIVDLVSSGRTLKENGLQEVDTILQISSKLVINRGAYKTRSGEMKRWIEQFSETLEK